MPNRLDRILQAVTFGLLAVIAFQIFGLILRRNPLTGLETPQAPHWQLGETNAATGTNALIPNTNRLAPNGIVGAVNTNLPIAETNHLPAKGTKASVVATNDSTVLTNGLASRTNALVSGTNSASSSTYGPPIKSNTPLAGGPPPSGRGMNPRGPRSATPLSPLIQARIDRITQSEVLAPVFRPPPMALLGIAGHDAFIRTPSGQSTLLREGGESDGIKLLRLGTNRVLIEQGGEKKELLIFEGFGSESLLPK